MITLTGVLHVYESGGNPGTWPFRLAARIEAHNSIRQQTMNATMHAEYSKMALVAAVPSECSVSISLDQRNNGLCRGREEVNPGPVLT